MKVSKAIEYLLNEPQDSEIFIAWWDKEYAETGTDKKISDEVWSIAIDKANSADYWSTIAGETLTDMVEEALKEVNEQEKGRI
jgi:hypothetical protein